VEGSITLSILAEEDTEKAEKPKAKRASKKKQEEAE